MLPYRKTCYYEEEKDGKRGTKVWDTGRKTYFYRVYNYFQIMKIYFHGLINYFQGLVIYFQALKIILYAVEKTFILRTKMFCS